MNSISDATADANDDLDTEHGDVRLRKKFGRAVAYTLKLHRTQLRKGSDIPYVGHLLGVSSIVIDAGGEQDEAIAALLHDGPEDQGGRETLDEIRENFGRRVADIVEHLSDTLDTDADGTKPPWRPRKVTYLMSLKESQDISVRLVSAADKLHNLRSMLDDYRVMGEALWDKFSAPLGRADILWYHDALLAIYETGPKDPRIDRILGNMRDVLDSIRTIARGARS